MSTMKIAELVLDFDLYPRAEIDRQHVGYMVSALSAGAKLPAIIVDKASNRIVDGFHRYRAYQRFLGDDGEISVVLKKYDSEAAMFSDSMKFNAGHGRSLTTFDRTHCILRAETLGLTVEQIAEALSLTVDAIGELRSDRVGKLRAVSGGSSEPIPLKRTIRHMAGRSLTKEQNEANNKLSGMEQLFYVNQLILIIEAGLLDMENENLMAGLLKLAGLIEIATKEEAA